MDKVISNNLEQIGKRLKELRIECGFSSYRKFADEYDIEPKQYWRLEEGKSDFRISSLIRVLEIHELSLQVFFKDLNSK